MLKQNKITVVLIYCYFPDMYDISRSLEISIVCETCLQPLRLLIFYY